MIFNTSHPLWLVGFRPLFTLAALSGFLLPLCWVLIVSGTVSLGSSPLGLVQWHAHEMFYGFGWALLGGFLLTASKNWVSVRGWHGGALMWLTGAWLLERIVFAFGGQWPHWFILLVANLFLTSIVSMLLWTLIRHRRSDSYADNYFFLILLPLFIVAKNLLIDERYFLIGETMSVALFRLTFLIMLERTLTQFMRGAFQVSLRRIPWMDNAIKLLALLVVANPWWPAELAVALTAGLMLLLAVRLMYWAPVKGFSRIDIGIMYLGYCAIIVQPGFEIAACLDAANWVGSVSIHLFSFGVMGLIIPAMMIRIAKGHTGRKVSFDRVDKLILWLMIAAFMVRIVIPQWLPQLYQSLLALAGIFWSLGFLVIAGRYIPFLFRPRVDGKEH